MRSSEETEALYTSWCLLNGRHSSYLVVVKFFLKVSGHFFIDITRFRELRQLYKVTKVKNSRPWAGNKNQVLLITPPFHFCISSFPFIVNIYRIFFQMKHEEKSEKNVLMCWHVLLWALVIIPLILILQNFLSSRCQELAFCLTSYTFPLPWCPLHVYLLEHTSSKIHHHVE